MVVVVGLAMEVFDYSRHIFIQALEMMGMLVRVLVQQLSHQLVLARMVVGAEAQEQQDLADLAVLV